MSYLFVHLLRDLVLMQPDLGMCVISFVHLLRDLVLMQPDQDMCAISICSFAEGPCIDAT